MQASSNHGIGLHILARSNRATFGAYILTGADHNRYILLLHFSSSITEAVTQFFHAIIALLTASQLGC